MKSEHVNNRFRLQLQPALKSKLDEFVLLGYKTINEEELWNYLTRKKWKKAKEELKLFELVQQIMEVKISDFIHYATIEAFKASEMSIITEEERLELLK